jgi:hypothetical protein
MEDKLFFTQEAKERYSFMIEDICHMVNGFTAMTEDDACQLLEEMLRLRRKYCLGREGIAHMDDHKRNFTLLKGGK